MTEEGIAKLTNEEQSSNNDHSISLIESDNLIDTNDEHFWKEDGPIEYTDDCIDTSTKELQS